MPLHITTPLIESLPISAHAGREVWLKMEAAQPCGSFKLRGVGLACETHVERGAQRLVSSSGGNAGLAVAYAGRKLGVPVVVVVPETTPARARELLQLEGAQVQVVGASWQEANAHAQSLLGARDAFIHPFDDSLLWQGHASLVDEVAQAGLVPDAVVLSVGGGGLLSGVALGMQRNGWGAVPIIAVETHGAASLHQAMQSGHTVELPAITTVATSLGAKRVCEQALRWSQERPVHSVLVSDHSALTACERLMDDHRVVVEPACGAALAVAYEQHAALQAYTKVLVIVCGGATATVEQIRQWRLAVAPQ